MSSPQSLKPFGNFQLDEDIWMCHVCDRMQERKPWYQKGPPEMCLLCARSYCETHKGKEDGVCEINHRTYFKNHHAYKGVYRSLEDREKALEKQRQREGQQEKEEMSGYRGPAGDKEKIDGEAGEAGAGLS